MNHYETLLSQGQPFYKEESPRVHVVELEGADSLNTLLAFLRQERTAPTPLVLHLSEESEVLRSEKECRQFETAWKEQEQHPAIVGIFLPTGESWLSLKRLALRLNISFVQKKSDQELEAQTDAVPHELVLRPGDTIDDVINALHQLHEQDVQSVVLTLAHHGQAFQSEEDFVHLHRQGQPTLPEIAGFVIPPGSEWASVRHRASLYGVPYGETCEAVLRAGHTEVSAPKASFAPPFVQRKPARKFPRILVAGIFLASLAVIAASGLGALMLAQHKNTPSLASGPARVGMAAFVSSSHGINDEVQLLLPSLPALSAGKVYTLWLVSDQKQSDTLWFSLGTVKADGTTQMLAPSDGSHADLLTTYSKLCITASDAANVSLQPQESECLYEGEMTQKPNANDVPEHYSFLDHARHLLASDPTLESLGIHNGLIYNWNALLAKVNEWSSAAVGTTGDMQLVHRHLVRILDVLDGSKYVKNDVPPGTGILVDATSIRVGMLRGDATAPSYVGHIEKHLLGILNSPDVTPEQVQLTSRLLGEMQHIADDLENIYNDARSLAHMSTAQLTKVTGTLQDMAANASDAYAGGYGSALSQTRVAGSKDLYTTFQKFSIITISAK